MIILIKSAKLIDINSKFHNKVVDILIKNTNIEKIGQNIKEPKNCKIIKYENLHVSPGLFDLRANFRDPGYEWKEDINTGIKAAAKGGFTGVMTMPSTSPCIDNKTQIEYIKKISFGKIVDILPSGSITKKINGKELSEMYDMYKNGAIAFTDDENSIQDAGIMKLALQHCKNFNGLIINQPNDLSLSDNSSINEGITSTSLGLKGSPGIAEEIMLIRDIELAKYTNSKIHISCISTAKSVKIVRKAKKNGVQITCDVAIHNLILDDSNCMEFNTCYKVNPPLRTKDDIREIINGLKDGTIDAICSDHKPQDFDSKNTTFNEASYGMISLESAFPLACELIDKLSIELIIIKMANSPRKILNLSIPSINEGVVANLFLYNPNMHWILKENDIISKSKNSPFIGKKLKAKVYGIINNGKNQLA